MGKMLKMLAYDFGASSGRAVLGRFDGSKLAIEEMHRFSNDPVNVLGSWHWDVLRLLHEIKQGLLKCGHGQNKDFASVGIDTWGVDFGFLDETGTLMGNPYHYRDNRTDGMMEEAFRIMPREKIYEATGIQFMKFNTIFQLLSIKLHSPAMLERARTMLTMPDLLGYFLTGEKTSEFTHASTMQLLDPYTQNWNFELIRRFGFPENIFIDVTQPGRVLAPLSGDIADELGIRPIPLVSVAEHDTGSAVAAVPAMNRDFVYISSGTWSLMGTETQQPVINEKTLEWSFTNEGGVNGTTRLLKNIMGLWLVQESKHTWDKEGEIASFAELEQQARNAVPFACFIDPDDERFMSPGDMPSRIRQYCKETSQSIPGSKGEVIRCIIESLALKYRRTLEKLEELLGHKVPAVHMVGGGIKDKLLCQFAASAMGRPVYAGPVEATAIGNLLVQAIALGEIKNLEEGRKIVADSFAVQVYEPQDTELWNEAYGKFCRFVKQ